MTSRERFADGGYLFASCNNLQADIPLENIDAMYAAAADTDGRTLVIASAADPSLSLPFRYSVFWFAVSLSFMIGLIMKLLPPS